MSMARRSRCGATVQGGCSWPASSCARGLPKTAAPAPTGCSRSTRSPCATAACAGSTSSARPRRSSCRPWTWCCATAWLATRCGSMPRHRRRLANVSPCRASFASRCWRSAAIGGGGAAPRLPSCRRPTQRRCVRGCPRCRSKCRRGKARCGPGLRSVRGRSSRCKPMWRCATCSCAFPDARRRPCRWSACRAASARPATAARCVLQPSS
jgi:hypothetical protein